MNNSTLEAENNGGYFQANEYTYVVIAVFGLVFSILSIVVACVRYQMSPSHNMVNIFAGFPPQQHRQRRSVENMELALHHHTDSSYEEFPKLLYSEVQKNKGGSSFSSCSICLGDYKESDTLRLLPDCGHVYHAVCVDPWLRLHTTCPICRKSPLQTP